MAAHSDRAIDDSIIMTFTVGRKHTTDKHYISDVDDSIFPLDWRRWDLHSLSAQCDRFLK